MKQKIVIGIVMENDKCRSKALKIASEEKGVISVSVGGDNKLEVIGDNVNTVCLAKQLSKKFSSVNILTVEVLQPPTVEEEEQVVVVEHPPPGGDDDGGNAIVPVPYYPAYEPHCHYRPDRVVVVVYDSYNDGYGPANCSIL